MHGTWRLWSAVLLLLVLSIVLLRPAPSQPLPPRGVAATVDEQPVPLSLYRREFDIYRVTLPGIVPRRGSVSWRLREATLADRALRQAIAETIIMREAARRGLKAAATAVQAELARMQTEAGGADALAAIARSEGLREADLRDMARVAVLNDLLQRRSRDPHLVDRLYARARVRVYVGPRAGTSMLAPAPLVGHPAPEIAASTLGGRPIALTALRGTPVVLNIWATTCTWCRVEMPLLDRFAHAHPGIRVIELDVGEDRATVAAYVRALGLHLTVWLDPNATAADVYRLTGLPDTYVIDRGGIVRAVTIGALDSESGLRQLALAAR